MNLTEGPIFKQIVLFALPVYGSMMLQLLFNAADLVIVGQYASHQALAAVGSTTSLIHLLINFICGISLGSNVVAAHAYGAGDKKKLDDTVHTSMLVSIINGILGGLAGILAARWLLIRMGTPDDVIDGATLYFQIFFFGLPFLQVYNFGTSILRAVGDTQRPLIYLTLAGIVNVLLNMFFVIVCHMTVDGVAWATVASEALSAILVWRALTNTGDGVKLEFRKLRIHGGILKKIIILGVPAGLQGAAFSLSNVVIQSAINTFGSVGMAGNAATQALESMTYSSANCFHHAATSFTAQNYGARNLYRIKRAAWICIFCAMGCSGTLALLAFLNGSALISIFNDNPEVIEWGLQRMSAVFTTFSLIGFLEAVSGSLRGLGKSLFNTLFMIGGICGIRLLWVFFAFPHNRTIQYLFFSYPISWIVSDVVMGIYLYLVIRKIQRTNFQKE